MKSPPSKNETPTKTNPPKQSNQKTPTQNKTAEPRCDRCQFIGQFMQEMIALYCLDMVWQQTQKEEPKKSPGHTRRRVKQQKHYAETRDPPSQDRRGHMAQADRHNNSPIVTSKQTTTPPRRKSFHQRFGLCEWRIKYDGNEHLLQDCYCFVLTKVSFPLLYSSLR